MKLWKIVLHVSDAAEDERTGETFRHLSKKQIKRAFADKLDVLTRLRTIRVFVEEEEQS